MKKELQKYSSLDKKGRKENYKDALLTANWNDVKSKKQELITLYFDYSYKILKKYKKELLQIQNNKVNDYNEVLCYNYEIEKFYFLTTDKNDSYEHFKKYIKTMSMYEFEFIVGKNRKELGENLSKKLKQYQNKNNK